MLFRRLNKKGDVRTIAPVELVGHVLGGIVVILILLIITAFVVFLFSEENQEFAINNFIALSNKIETLSNSRNQFEVQREFPFYLPPNFVVVGFNKEWNNKEISDGCKPEAVRKPGVIDGKEGQKCQNSACICLFTNNNDFMDGDNYNVELIQCRDLPKVDYITTIYLRGGKDYKYPESVYETVIGQRINLRDYSSVQFTDYAFTYIYGQCHNLFRWDQDLQSRKLYVEKFTNNNGVTYIFIAPELHLKDPEKSIIDQRYENMIKKYGNPS